MLYVIGEFTLSFSSAGIFLRAQTFVADCFLRRRFRRVSGFVGFVSNLQKQYLPQQFALFCWVHMSLLVIVVSSHFIVNNILEVRISSLLFAFRVRPLLARDSKLTTASTSSNLSGNDLVLLPRLPRGLQRRLGVHLRFVRSLIHRDVFIEFETRSSPVRYLFHWNSTGMTFGKTPLFKLSPKKTVEGFVGGLFCTLIFGVLVRPRLLFLVRFTT